MIDGFGRVPGIGRGQIGMALRESARFILVQRRSNSAHHLHRLWRAIAQALRLANFDAVDPMLARIPSLDTPKAPATEGLAEFDRTQTEQKPRHPNRPQKLHRLGVYGSNAHKALAEFILSSIPQHAVSGLGPRCKRCSQVKHRLTPKDSRGRSSRRQHRSCIGCAKRPCLVFPRPLVLLRLVRTPAPVQEPAPGGQRNRCASQ
jgi:hypothetical protein